MGEFERLRPIQRVPNSLEDPSIASGFRFQRGSNWVTSLKKTTRRGFLSTRILAAFTKHARIKLLDSCQTTLLTRVHYAKVAIEDMHAGLIDELNANERDVAKKQRAIQ